MEHVQDTIYAELICPGANVGIIATAKGTLVVDTPLLGRQAEAIDRALADAGHQPVRFILISHPHGDHILGTDLFGQKVLIIGNREARERMAEPTGAWVREWARSWNWSNRDEIEEMARAHISQPEILFDEALSLNLGGVEMHIVTLPGHMSGEVGVFVPASRVLITGDALFSDHHPYMGEANFTDWLQSLRKMKALDPVRIIPGHGPVCGLEAVDRQQAYMERMIEIRGRWNPDAGEAALPAAAVEELLAFYPLHGRPEAVMRARIVESIRVAGDDQYYGP